jgi:tetratricopeptide (TPR) repeat protein
MRTLIMIVTAFFFAVSGMHAQKSDLFDSGNQAYATGKFADAVRDFEEAVGRKEYSAPLFYNLGNAYFREGKTGPAILNYERALWLNPADPDAKANLRFVRKTAGLFEPSTTWWQMVPGWLSLDAWSWTAAWCWFFLCAALIVRWLLPRAKGTGALKPLIAVWTVVLAISLAAAMIRFPDVHRAVVLAQDAPLRVAPVEKSAALSSLKAGDMVRIENQRGDFLYVSTEDGKTGWTTIKETAPVVD